jgi:hypothetical protein
LVTGATDGMLGTVMAQYDVKRALSRGGARIPSQEVLVSKFKERFDEAGNITDPKTKEVLTRHIAEFLKFAER